MGFLGDLSDSLSAQLGIQQNNTTGLDSIIDGQQVQYGALGNFASEFDHTAERRYVEEGYLQKDPYETDPKLSEILWQEPNSTVLVKKKMFSSVAENFRPDFMDADERLYYKAMCLLFQNKCVQISALEKLSKIQQVTAAVGSISEQLYPWIITLTDTVVANSSLGNGAALFGAVAAGSNPMTTQDMSSFISVVNRLRVVNTYSQTNPYTTWISDPTNLFQANFGPGTGVIELTNFTNINTTTSVDLRSPGHFSFTISDPYESMIISDYDIELAISDATNVFYNNKSFEFGTQSINQTINTQQGLLNSQRAARSASPITFKIQPNSLSSNQVIAIIDRTGLNIPFTYDSTGGTGIPGVGLTGLGNDVTVPADYLFGGHIAGYDGLATTSTPIGPFNNIVPLISNSELTTFQAIVTAIFQQLQLLKNASIASVTNNETNNYARRKLRFNFSGKLVISPMDVVHIYMNSKSQFDAKILTGLEQMFSGGGILQNITNTPITPVDTLFNPSGNIALQAEKSIYAGPDFPNYLWALVRSNFVNDSEGTHVFAGLVDSCNDNWNQGKFTMEIAGKDNTAYFDQGVVNFKPGVDAFCGLIFDPLTPFKSNFDSVTVNAVPATLELLDENKYLMTDTGAGSLLKYKLGSMAGQKATTGNYIQDQGFNQNTAGTTTRTFFAPDGLAYKWKQGIGIFTQFGSTTTINDPSLVGSPNVFNEPFAGLDVMNVLSLLIAGVPYSYATFYKGTSGVASFSGDPNSGNNASYSFINSLQTSLLNNNTLWGNFIPFKNLIMNQSAVAAAMQAQITATSTNAVLDGQLKQLQVLNNAMTGLGALNAISSNVKSSSDPSIAAQITALQAQSKNLVSQINSNIAAFQAAASQFSQQTGNAAAYSSNSLTDGQNDPSDSAAQDLIRKQVNYLTRRMSYDVRANDDKNLFIVDDYYDLDYDVAAYNQALTDGIKLFSNNYTTVREQITNVAHLLDLEVFADSQGHIRCRPPQYNKMPSSVFFRMLYIKQLTGVQVFPQFMDSLLTDTLTILKQNIEVIEDQIRYECAILGHKASIDSDLDSELFITNANITSGMSTAFNFISDPTDTITDINNLIQQANQDVVTGSMSQNLSDYAIIAAAGTSTKTLFNNVVQYTVLSQALQAQNQAARGFSVNSIPTATVLTSTVVQQLITRIQTKSGQTMTSQDYLTPAVPNQPQGVDVAQTIDVFKVTNDLSKYMQDWQNAVKLFYQSVKNAAEYVSLNDDTSISNQVSTTGTFGNSHIPELFQHMIEDEGYDDYGINSGQRYVIKGSQVRSWRLQEQPPPYNSVEVHGTISPVFSEKQSGGGAPSLNSFPGGGNAQVTALAMDYDMWRNYGFKQGTVIEVPFLTDPETQCGPYAAMVLTKGRSNILQGTVTISGNEYMQPGEVVYLEDRNLLFYVRTVSHSITEGQAFTTTLELNYGHTAGDYIPTYLDTIGKLIYKNSNATTATTTIIQRQDNSSQEKNLGVVQIDGATMSPNVLSNGNSQYINPYSATNGDVINNILYNTSYVINANGTPGNNIKASLELRVYFDNNTPASSNLLDYAQQVEAQLTGTSQGPQSNFSLNQPSPNPTLPFNSVTVVGVNIDSIKDKRSPSQQAINAAFNQMLTLSVNTGPTNPTSVATLGIDNTPLRNVLYNYVIDCWLVFTMVPSTVASGTSAATNP